MGLAMKSTWTLAAWFGCLLLLSPVHARAEIVTAESIEWVLATSDLVVVGKVIQVDKVADRNQKECQVVTVAVSKTLKGMPTKRQRFVMPSSISSAYAKQWQEEGIPLVFCLVRNDGKRVSVPAARFPWVVRDHHNGADAVLLGKSKNHWTGCIPVLTRDFQVITEPDAIVKFMEQTVAAQAKGAVPRCHKLHVPPRTPVHEKLWSESAVYLIVPMDKKLEVLGQEWCQSRSPWKRMEGAKILGHFKSEKNITILKALLDDPTTSDGTFHRVMPGQTQLIWHKKFYGVRQAAFDALRELGVNVKKPVLEELLEGRDEPDSGPDR